ncbi:UNVERIFIED_CONTAM: hypothetical protein FKN15_054990 [Acipenser sinensis]
MCPNPVLFSVSEGHPQAVLTLQPAWAQIFTGETVTLSCDVEGASADWWFKQYRDGREEAGCSDQYRSRYGNNCTISTAQYYHSGEYWYQWVILQTPPQPVIEGDTLTLRCRVRTEIPQAVLTREPAWTQIYESERVTLRCHVQGGYTDWRFTWYKAGRNGPVTQDYYSSIDGDRYTISFATGDHSGEYTCKGERRGNPSYSKTSAALTLRVSADTPKPVLTREPAGEIFEGDTVTLSCVVEGGSGVWRYLWYKDRQGAPVYQTDSSSGTGAGYTISAAALSHSGEYWCGAGRGRNTSYSQYSHPIWVNVTALFSRVTLTASPGATVKEGEALNLTCEAAVNKTPRPELHYTIVRDGEPVTNSTDSALYSIASTEKSHTGSYTCAVESQGVKKSSQELHIELQKAALSVKVYGAHEHTLILYLPPPASWQRAAAAAGFSVGFFVILLLIVFTLLLLYHKIRVDVTLDPDTAHPWLTLSAEGKRVRLGETGQDLPDNPERFDVWRCVLGRESFTSGRRYWQVQVGGNTLWRLGVSRESAERKGGISMTPQQGYWTVRWSGGVFTAHTDPQTPLPWSLKPQKLGVYLDYEEGQLSFYNAETRSHIYTFTDMEFNPNEKLYPLFCTVDENTALVLESPDPDPVSAAD